ncbi:MAG: short-chain dehydrogenase, partial [Rubritepida sp.]|nr:short-chain dehydrogenase [Rubritepida sp.]
RLAHAVAPGLTARLARWLTDRALERAGPAPVTNGNLFEPSRVHTIDGGYRTLAVRAMPVAALALASGVGLGVLGGMRPRRRRPQDVRRMAARPRSAR